MIDIRHTSKDTSFKQSTFRFIKFIFQLYRTRHCRIDKIRKDPYNFEYSIFFIYTNKRQIFVKTAAEIYSNESLLNEFLPHEAALIGFYTACSHIEKINQKNNNTYLNYKT